MKKKPFKASKYQKELHTLWSKVVRSRDKECLMNGYVDPKGTVLKCNNNSLHAHHWLHRDSRSMQTRFDTNNGVSLCYACHFYKIHGNQGDAMFMREYLDRCDRKFSKEIQDELNRKVVSMEIRATLYFFEQIKEDLKKQLDSYTIKK